MKLAFVEITSPVGRLKLVANDEALIAVLWEHENPNRVRLAELLEQPNHPILVIVQKQLNEYFTGKRKQFDLPLNFQGTEFQKKFGKLYLRYLMPKRVLTNKSQHKSVILRLYVQSVLLMVKIQYQSLRRVTVLLVRMGNWSVLQVV